MTVAEMVATLLELDQDSEVFFTKPEGMEHIYVVAKLPDGKKALAEVPTAILKPKEDHEGN
jgi:hypothetical protein